MCVAKHWELFCPVEDVVVSGVDALQISGLEQGQSAVPVQHNHHSQQVTVSGNYKDIAVPEWEEALHGESHRLGALSPFLLAELTPGFQQLMSSWQTPLLPVCC